MNQRRRSLSRRDVFFYFFIFFYFFFALPFAVAIDRRIIGMRSSSCSTSRGQGSITFDFWSFLFFFFFYCSFFFFLFFFLCFFFLPLHVRLIPLRVGGVGERTVPSCYRLLLLLLLLLLPVRRDGGTGT